MGDFTRNLEKLRKTTKNTAKEIKKEDKLAEMEKNNQRAGDVSKNISDSERLFSWKSVILLSAEIVSL